tara:strand:+ start:45 stop:272 length:228 start_codon:yes stop_codon:yes gene_type:complete
MKLNGFENYIITEAVNYYKEKAEENVANLNKKHGDNSGKCLIAPGYYTMVCEELLYKIDKLTLKSYIKDRDKENK